MLKIRTTVNPTEEPITKGEFKTHARIDWSDDDGYIDDLIVAARRALESELNRFLITQTAEIYFDSFPAGREITIPRPPLQSVNSITFYDPSDAGTVLSTSDYYVDTISEPGRVVLRSGKVWPSGTLRAANGVVVDVTAGYGDQAADVPGDIRHLLKLFVSHLYENREPVVIGQGLTGLTVPNAIANLVALNRVEWRPANS